MSMSIDLSGHLALVTGGSGRLGSVIAASLAVAGANVAIHYHLNRDAAIRVKKECECTGTRLEIFQADVTDLQSVQDMQFAVNERMGSPDIVVANAVTQYEWTSVLEQPLNDYESQFRSSILQSVLLAKIFGPAMIDRGWGRFIAINSECVMLAARDQSAYAAGKGGLDRLIRVLARELGPYSITANQVMPGWIQNDADAGSPLAATYSQHVPLLRRGTAQDVANATLFLASGLAAFITGAIIPVCGGNVMPTV